MIIKFLYPNCFVPEEKEFQIYCALKLLKGGYIRKEEAKLNCGFPEDKFDAIYNNFEEEYIKKCDGPYADWVFEKDPDEKDLL